MSLSDNNYKNDFIGLSISENIDFFVNHIYSSIKLGGDSKLSFTYENIVLHVIVKVDDYFLVKPYLNNNKEIVFELVFFSMPSKNELKDAILLAVKQFFKRAVTLDDDTIQIYNSLDNLN